MDSEVLPQLRRVVLDVSLCRVVGGHVVVDEETAKGLGGVAHGGSCCLRL